jgi:hypothetical protein
MTPSEPARPSPSTVTDETRLRELTSTEVVAVRLGDTPDWVWSPIETAPHDYYVELLYDLSSGLTPVVGIYRKGRFWGREVDGWFATERISETGHPSHGMWIDGLIKGWRPYRYHLETAALRGEG